MTLSVHWATDYEGIANSFGYSVHNDFSREALVKAGVTLDDNAPIAVHVCPPHRMTPIEGKRNILYTAWEVEQFPEMFRERMAPADAICVPASFLKRPLEELLPGKPIHVIPLGVDAKAFAYVDRMEAKYAPKYDPPNLRKFRFMFMGAPNARKGGLHVLEAWKAFATHPTLANNCELYFKTSMRPEERKGVHRQGNIIYDDRKLPLPELVRLYQRAHCFVFPSVGEGFGLGAVEAMATGCPMIYVPGSAFLDTCPPEMNLGYPVKFDWHPQHWEWEGELYEGSYMDVHCKVHNADVVDLAKVMIRVYQSWNEAYQKGKMAASWARKTFTWTETGRKLKAVVESMAALPCPANA